MAAVRQFVSAGLLESLLNWLPRKGTFALLCVATEQCRFSVSKDGGRTFTTQQVPSLIRSEKGQQKIWGSQAKAWKGRTAGARHVFQQGHPVDPQEAAQFLRWFCQKQCSTKPPKKLFVAASSVDSWRRELWSETLDSTPFRLAGFLTPLQRSLALARTEWTESGLRRVVLLDLKEHSCRWQATQLEGDPIEGECLSLSARRLREELRQFARFQCHVEVCDEELEQWLRGDSWPECGTVRGCHVGSSLPTERLLNTTEFWSHRQSLAKRARQFFGSLLAELAPSATSEVGSLREQLQERGYYLLLDGPGWPLLLQSGLGLA